MIKLTFILMHRDENGKQRKFSMFAPLMDGQIQLPQIRKLWEFEQFLNTEFPTLRFHIDIKETDEADKKGT